MPVLGRAVPVVKTSKGIRAAVKGEAIEPESVERYLEQKFGDELEDVRVGVRAPGQGVHARELDSRAYELYEKFRPGIPEGKKGWGAQG